MFAPARSWSVALLLTLAATARAQGVIDLLDGETLYDGGFLLTLGSEYERKEELWRGSHHLGDPAAGHEFATRSTLALQYGLRHDLQIGFALPYTTHDLTGSGGGSSTAGIGDLELLGKWRFYRWDAPGKALNMALLAELSLPTGADDATRAGNRLEPELQAGSGGIDPVLGLGITHEPGRWRFNAAALSRWHQGSDGDHARPGDELVAELAAGNRFWLEPYPGPFMRLDLVARCYWQDHSHKNGTRVDDSGGERATLGVNWAFRPRPALDFQLYFEVPVWQQVDGTQYADAFTVDFTFGYRF